MRPALFTVALAALLAPEVASACTRAAGLDLWLPPPDAVDVPTDVELVLVGIALSDVSVKLEDESTGVSTTLTLRADPLGLEASPYQSARPAAPLRPQTWYALRMTPGLFVGTLTRRFRTGNGPARDVLPTPNVLQSQAVDNLVRSSCGGSNLACLALDVPFTWEVTVRRRCDDAVTARLLYRDASKDLAVPYDALFSGAPSCFEVRARDGAGRLGGAARVCPDPATVAYVAHQFACETRCVDGRVEAGGVAVALPPHDETPPACVGRFPLDAAVVTTLRADHHARAADAAVTCVDAMDAADDAPTSDLATTADAAPANDAATNDALDAATDAAGEAEPPVADRGGCDGCVAQPRTGGGWKLNAWALAALLGRRRRVGDVRSPCGARARRW
ncbi:MAG: hypothetical protein U0324_23800 [Polyangiales bacterium]